MSVSKRDRESLAPVFALLDIAAVLREEKENLQPFHSTNPALVKHAMSSSLPCRQKKPVGAKHSWQASTRNKWAYARMNTHTHTQTQTHLQLSLPPTHTHTSTCAYTEQRVKRWKKDKRRVGWLEKQFFFVRLFYSSLDRDRDPLKCFMFAGLTVSEIFLFLVLYYQEPRFLCRLWQWVISLRSLPSLP